MQSLYQLRIGMRVLLVLLALSVPGAPQSRAGKAPPAPERAPAPDLPVPFHLGETLTYDVSWSNAVSAGTATFTVNGKIATVGNRTAYDIVAEVSPGFLLRNLYPIYYKLQTSLDTKTLLPIQATMYSQERTRKRTKTTKFLGPTSVEYEYQTASTSKTTVTVEKLTRDPLSLFYAVRGMTFTAGQVVSIPVTDSGQTYRISVRAGGYEQVKTVAGTFRAMRLTPTIIDSHGKPVTDRKLSLWISDDARHLPVRFESVLAVGSFVLNLSRVTG